MFPSTFTVQLFICQVVEILTPQKKPSFHLWFKILLGLVFLILCFTLYIGSLTWGTSPLQGHYHRVSGLTNLLEAPTGTLYHKAYARNYHFIMNNPEVCKTKTPFLILMVPVAPGNLEARDAIRQTWGNLNLVQGEVVVTLFMLGVSKEADVQQQKKLQQENLQHQDLIQSNFIDSYLNLTIKTMVIMDWLATFCPTAAYSMKIDSGMFLNIDNLVIMLHMPGIPQVNYLTGMLMLDRPVVRSLDSKWYVSEEMYPDPSYPTYTMGMGYVFSNDLPRKYVDISMSIKPFNIEDAYIGVCMKKLGLEPTSPPNPSQFKAYAGEYNRCDFSQVITYILGSAKNLIDYWTDLKKPGPPC
ncbi:beta-1,3-galactosyltransferase 2-like [Limanda limanda]|uniref:beta-1,3-galactosyltransferase 2-like n=1 Tax=Limanda limanda TaxID=27771 RepID=UPI0029C6B22A|nr:beta-1,3-galactosyltransferase 2-like [Limanda limanda]